jgi:hypothetical protein
MFFLTMMFSIQWRFFLITNQAVHLYKLEHVLFHTEHTKHIFIIENVLCTLWC